ncbi:MAG: hypothetical protein JW717_01840 [Marinilabiliaceae bacterium]|nr:hypothetical protein [Marinilabiliaceae bacterium]
MNSFVKNLLIKITASLIIVVIGLMVANKGIYTHSHILKNGTVYTHAHPYNNTNDSSPYKSHQHKSSDLLFYQNIDLVFFSLFIIAFFLFVFKQIKKYYFKNNKYNYYFALSNLGRAPPIA